MGDWDSRVGGGIWIAGAGAKIIHNRITHNTLDDTQDAIVTNVNGAGIGTPYEDANFWLVIADNTIDSNSCISNHYQASGAGICTSYSSRLINNVISYNICTGQLGAGTIGGGICLAGEFWTNPLIMIAEHNTITHNISQSESMANSAGVLAQVAQVKFSGNEVSENSVIDGLGIEFSGGGGMFLLNPQMGSVVTNNVFTGNTSNQYAGGVHLKNFDPEYIPVLFENNYFIDNEAKYGGAISSVDVPIIIQNNVFTGNFASSKGGVAYIWKADTNPDEHLASLINNTFSNNHADTTGGAIYSYDGNPVVFNSVFWQNPDMNGNEIASESGFAEIAYSDIDTNLISGEKMIGEGIIFLDPVFGDTDLLTLSELSPCINKGTEAFTCQCGTPFPCPEHDIIGILRPQNGLVDMGAYETILEGIWDHPLGSAELRHSISPNPFTDQAQLSYELDKKTQVEINLYNSNGELIQTLLSEHQEAGKHELQFNSGNLPAGIYFYRITTDIKQATGRMIILK